MSLGLFRESLELQKSGAPIVLGDSTFYVRRSGTPDYWKARRDIVSRTLGLYLQVKPEDELKISAHMLSDYLVTGWENVFDEDGSEISYSKSAARSVFLNEEYFLSLNKALEDNSWLFQHFLQVEAENDLEELKKK